MELTPRMAYAAILIASGMLEAKEIDLGAAAGALEGSRPLAGDDPVGRGAADLLDASQMVLLPFANKRLIVRPADLPPSESPTTPI